MKTQCLLCKHFSLERHPKWSASQGYGSCAHHEPFIAYDPLRNRECDKFSKVDPQSETIRNAWAARRNKVEEAND